MLTVEEPAMQVGGSTAWAGWWCSFATRPAALPSGGMSVGRDRETVTGERARRRAARELIGAYHEEQLRGLLEHVREGFARLDRGEIDAFDLDELIHRYKRSARELWKFCGSSGSGWERAAKMLTFLRGNGEEPDWWSAGEPHRRA
jgi:hypothetical protein